MVVIFPMMNLGGGWDDVVKEGEVRSGRKIDEIKCESLTFLPFYVLKSRSIISLRLN